MSPHSGRPGDRAPSGEPERVGPYRVLGVLGRGGMGVVYRAEHLETGAVVALKTVSAVTGTLLDGLRAEIRALARLCHPGVVKIVDDGLDEGAPWYAMELLEGGTLAARIDAAWGRAGGTERTTQVSPGPRSDSAQPRAPVPATAPPPRREEVLRLVYQICEALVHVHGEGIVHRDLNPSNIFLRAGDDRPVLMDFGLVSRFRGAFGRESLEARVPLMGTLEYMAPEQLRREPVDARADLYALGCILYQLLTGRTPFVGASATLGEQHLTVQPRPPSQVVTGVPRALDELVLRLLAKRPEERIGHAADVLELIAPLLPGARPPSAAPPHLYRPRLAGRAAELRRVIDRVRGAFATGTGCAVHVGGESGCGKTTFANEVTRQLGLSGVRVIGGECLPLAGESTSMNAPEAPLHPFRPFLRAVADRCRAGGPEAANRLLGPWGRLLAAHEPALRDVPGQAPVAPTPLAGEAARDRLIGAVCDLLAAFVGEAPLLIVLDDLQWADETSLAVLRALPGVLARCPLGVLVTHRSEELGPALRALVDAPGTESVTLGRLDAGAVRAMVADMLGMAAPPEPLAQFLVAASEGNPFFVAEYLRASAAEGIMARLAGQWRLVERAEGGESIPLPRSWRGLVGRRFTRLSEGARRLAIDAAVLGRESDPAVLAAMQGSAPPALEPLLVELAAAQVLERAAAGRCRYSHDKLREAALELLPEEARAATHRRAARALEGCSPDPDPFKLAYLYRAAGEPEKAFAYTYLAGRQAVAAGAFREAREHLGAALSLGEGDDGLRAALEGRGELAPLRRLLGEAQLVSGQPFEGIESLRRACQALGVPGPARGRGGWLALAVGELARLVGLALFRRRRRRAGVDATLEAAADMNRWVSLGWVFTGRRFEALAACLRAARLAEQANSDGQRSGTFPFLASVCGLAGMRGLEARIFRTSRQAAERSEHVVHRLWHASIETIFRFYRDADWAGIRRVAGPALAEAEANNLVYDRQPIDYAVALAAFEEGDVAAAASQFERIVARAAALGHQQYVMAAQGALLLCELYRGRHAHVVATAGRVAEQLRDPKTAIARFVALAVLASARLRLGDATGARGAVAEAFALLDAGVQVEGRPLGVRCLAELVEVALSLDGERPRAADACHRLLRAARRRPHLEPLALLQRARLEQFARQHQRAARTLRDALAAATARGMRPAAAFAHLALASSGSADERLVHAEEAAAAFRDVGLTWHLERAEQILQPADGS